jgi:thiol-disulfide isomerase/thioredoxin
VTRKSCPFTWTLQKPQQKLIQTSIRQSQSNFVVSKTELTHNNILNVKQISILLILTVLLSFKIEAGNKSNESSAPSVNSLLNKKVPHFTGYLINESVVDETYLDKKVILLNFMFIGCQGCMQELPNLDSLHEKYKNTNFMIVTIMGNGIEDIKSYQGVGDTSKVFYQIRKILKSESIRNPIIAECKSVKQTGPVNNIKTCTDNISKKFFIDEYPTNLLVDKSGIITKIYSNLANDAEYIDLQAQIDSLLK